MAEDIYLTLSNAYTPEKPLKKYREVTTKENGICYRANINPERAAVLFQIDGYVITSGAKCDKLLLSVNPSDTQTWYGHFIELKGTDTRHAIEQLEATITNALFNNSLKKKHARIVARSFPSSKANTDIENARQRFKRQYQCELKTHHSSISSSASPSDA